MRKILYLFLWMMLVPLCGFAKKDKKDFSIIGVWMMKSETAPDGKVTESIYTQYTRCKIYDADSMYYTVQLHTVGDEVLIIAHEKGKFHWDGSVYMERDRVMPMEVIDDTTFVTEFKGYKELMVKSETMTEERKNEIRELVRKYPNDEGTVKHFVLSTTERKLKARNQALLYIIILLCVAAVGVVFYVRHLQKRKKEMDRKLEEIEAVRELRPEPVANAMKQVEAEFYQSEYYQALRKRIEAGKNIKPEEWKELERKLKEVYPNFSSSLYGLYNLSPTEFQVCMLLKIRTKPVEIAAVLNKDRSTVSSIRTRLYKKVFGKEGKKGNGKDWDEFIFSL